jgi:hypothetical protein
MFGSNGGDDRHHGPDQSDLMAALFGYMLYREMREGRLDPDEVWRAGCGLVAIAGAIGLVLLAIAGLMSPQGGGSGWEDRSGFEAVSTATPGPTVRPVATPTPEPTPEPTPAPTPRAIGKAEIRFSGAYAAHYVAKVYDLDAEALLEAELQGDPTLQNGCLTEPTLGGTSKLAGFSLVAAAESKVDWTLVLNEFDWGPEMEFSASEAVGYLWWTPDLDGSLKRTKTGYVFDAYLSDGDVTVRARGTVTCR